MLFDRLWCLVPSRRILATIVLSGLAGASLAIAASTWLEAQNKPAPGPQPLSNPRFISLGKAYVPQLGKAYGAAWEDGAKQLEAGKDIAAGLDAVSKSWSARRAQLFDQVLTPEFAKIVAESVKDSDVTPEERSAMAAAWRGLSVGLAK